MHRQRYLFPALVLLTACVHQQPTGSSAPVEQPPKAGDVALERAGLILEKDAYGDSATRLVYLDQGWGLNETLWFYHADQGSVLMPYDILIHLEQADSKDLFMDPRNMARFRFLNQRKSAHNPDGLPIGFARHEDQVGLTCAACHTSQINYHGTAIRVDGAPALANVSGFLQAVKEALAATLADDQKLSRFAASVPGGRSDAAGLEAARKRLTDSLRWFESYETANHSSTQEGFGRLDAVGRIINQAIRFTSGPENSLEPNAPASFPMLWDTPRHDYVQWTAFAGNDGPGSLARNTGEVIGVFGRVEVKHYETDQEARKGYRSTIESRELVAMEESVRGLKSPLWPEQILPPIDHTLAARGHELYQKQCISCHATIDRADPRRSVVAMITGIDVVGTDDTSARNLVGARAPAGVLEGAISPTGVKYGAQVNSLELLGNLVIRTRSARPAVVVAAIANSKVHGLEKKAKQGSHTQPGKDNPMADLLSYKARPLNGIWASAPYLHNGSVPTLYDLLLPAADRPARFSVGRLEYDPRKVGFVSEGQEPFVLDTRVTGNSNRGHEFGTGLSEEERWALVEYLKTL